MKVYKDYIKINYYEIKTITNCIIYKNSLKNKIHLKE